MASLISDVWEGLRDAGLPEVMLYLSDNSACRCHWDDTAEVGGVRVALLADQDRQIVRIVAIDACIGIGIASPKGVDAAGYKLFIQKKLRPGEVEPELTPHEPLPLPAWEPAPEPPPPPAPPQAPTPDPLTSRFGLAMKSPPNPSRYGGAPNGNR